MTRTSSGAAACGERSPRLQQAHEASSRAMGSPSEQLQEGEGRPGKGFNSQLIPLSQDPPTVGAGGWDWLSRPVLDRGLGATSVFFYRTRP